MIRREIVGVVLLTLLASSLGLWNLGAKSIWLDEAFSVALARHNLESLVRSAWGLVSAGNMFLYYLLLHLAPWSKADEFGARLLSVAAATATVPFMYLLGRWMFGRTAGFVAALLLTIDAFYVQYAQEARSYSLVLLLVTAATYFFLRAVDGRSRYWWALYVAAAVAALYSHYFAAFVIAVHVLAMLFRRDAISQRALASFAVIGMAAAPLALAAAGNASASINWLPRPTPAALVETVQALAGSPDRRGLLAAYLGLSVIAVIAPFIWLKSGRRDLWMLGVASMLIVVPIAVSYTFSLVAKPIFIDRYLIVAVPGLVLLAGAGIQSLRSPWLMVPACAVFVVLAQRGVTDWYGVYQKEDWRDAVASIASEARAGDYVLVYPDYMRLPFDYYFAGSGTSSETRPLFPTSPWGAYFPNTEQGLPLAEALSAPRLVGVRRIWMIVRFSPPDPASLDGILINKTVGPDFELVRQDSFPYVGLLLYQRR